MKTSDILNAYANANVDILSSFVTKDSLNSVEQHLSATGSVTLSPNKAYLITTVSSLTLNVEQIGNDKFGRCSIILKLGSVQVIPGANLTLVDAPTLNAKNRCIVEWWRK